jgi:hypothetical protein
MESGEDEFGRLFQGFGDVEGKHVLEFINKSKIPAGFEATYARYTSAKRPKKEKPNRCRITAGGDQLEYHGNTTTIPLWRNAFWLWMISMSYDNSPCFSTSILCFSRCIAAKYSSGPSRFCWYVRRMIFLAMAQ